MLFRALVILFPPHGFNCNYDSISQIFPQNERIENINDQYWTLRVEEASVSTMTITLIIVFFYSKWFDVGHTIPFVEGFW